MLPVVMSFNNSKTLEMLNKTISMVYLHLIKKFQFDQHLLCWSASKLLLYLDKCPFKLDNKHSDSLCQSQRDTDKYREKWRNGILENNLGISINSPFPYLFF